LTALRASADLDLAADLLANAEEEDAELAEQRIEDALEALLDAEIAGNDDDTVR
jgi:plasmid stabilization system protein ParE